MARYSMPQHQGVKKLQRLSLIVSIAFFLSAMILAMSYEPAVANFGDPCAKYTKGSKKWKKCKSVKSHRDFFKKDAILSTDEERFMAGYWLAKNGQYREALDVLLKLKTNNDPRVLNYIGYATRKLGRVQEALVYYRQAISIAPDYVVSRAYGRGIPRHRRQASSLCAASRDCRQVWNVLRSLHIVKSTN